MSKVTTLAPRRVDQEIVEFLEELLEDARRGEVVGLVLTADRIGGEIESFSSFPAGPALLGHLGRQMFMVNMGIGNK